jgi:hypothetical protein
MRISTHLASLSQPIAFQSSHQNAWGPYPAGIPLPASSFPHSISIPTRLLTKRSTRYPTTERPFQQPHMHPRSNSVQPTPHSPSPPSGTPSLTAPLPTIQSLTTAFPTVQHPSHDPALKVNWARDVLMLVDRAQQNSSGDAPPRRTRHHTGSPTAAFRPDRGPARRADRVRPTPHANPHLCCGGDLPLRPVFCVRRVPGSRPTQPPSPSTTLTPHEQDTPRLGSTLAVIATFQRCNAYTRTRCQSRELWLRMSFSPLI